MIECVGWCYQQECGCGGMHYVARFCCFDGINCGLDVTKRIGKNVVGKKINEIILPTDKMKGKPIFIQTTSLESIKWFFSISYILYPLVHVGYPKQTHVLALSSNIVRWVGKVEINPNHFKTRS